MTTRAPALVANHATDMPPKPKQGAAPNATPSAPPKQRSKPLSAWSPRGQQAVTSGSIMPTEQLTFAQIAERLSVSPEAARAIVKRHRLPRSRSNDGKTLAAIDLKEIRHKPLPARSPRGRRSVTTVVATLKARIATLEAELVAEQQRSAGHRADFERERERADQLVTTQDRMVAELEALHSLLEAAQQAAPPVTSRNMARDDMARADPLAESMRSLLEAAQQAARPVTPRTWREMTWSERWRWLRLRTTGSERLTDRDLKAADELKAVLERMKEEAGFGKPTAPTARPGDGPESKIIRW